MLILAKKFSEINYPELIDVYKEQIQKNRLGPEKAEQDFYDFLTQTFFRVPGSKYAVWENGGKYLSAVRLEPYRDGYLIAGLETAPPCRRMGYGSMLINAVIEKISVQSDVILYSHVEKKNYPSMMFHKKFRFQKILDYAVYVDGSVVSSAVTLKRDVFG